MKITFVRVPRYVWPFNSETSAFWQPLGFMSLAGELAARRRDWRVRIIDCPGSKTGWGTLFSTLMKDKPDVVCVGEETVSADEALRLARFVKERLPGTLVLAGGVFFSYAGQENLAGGLVDYVVHGEGEVTLAELLETICDGGDVSSVSGISYLKEDVVVSTKSRELIADMDELPLPAWSKVPMKLYGCGSKNHPGLVSIEHGRGCIDKCSFCILWRHMGQPSRNGEGVRPYYRSKSAGRCFEEVSMLVQDFGRYTFGWVDPTWNVDAKWTDEFCESLLRKNLRIRQTAWLRADCVVRDERLGVLEKAVRAGLCQVMIGVERAEACSLKQLGKHDNGPEMTAKAFEIFRRKYPSVYTIGSVIFGLWDETKRSLAELSRYQYKVGMDYCFFIPLTPNPGTEVYEDARRRGIIEVDNHRAYNFHTPIMRTKRFSVRQLEKLYLKLLMGISLWRIRAHLRKFFGVRDERRRRVDRSLLRYGARISMRHIGNRFRQPFSNRPTTYSRKPKWYDS